jgi:hypothetical protein
MSYTCFESEGSSSGRRCTDACKTYLNVAVYTVQNKKFKIDINLKKCAFRWFIFYKYTFLF